MELRKIRWFLQIVEDGSLSKAAKSLYVSQPTLSRFLEKLETETGTALFTRDRGNILHLTEAGEAYLQAAGKIESIWKKLDRQLDTHRQQTRQLVFGIHGDHLRSFAEDCVKQMAKRYPEVAVTYFSDSSPEIQRLTVQGEICMGTCAYDEKDPGLSYAQCSKVPMNLVVSGEHPLASQAGKALTLPELDADAAFAMMRGNTVLRSISEKWLKSQRYEANIKQTYLRHGSLGDVLAGGKLIGFCPENNISPRLCYIPTEPVFYYTQGVCWQNHAAFTPAQRYLLSLLRKMPTKRKMD